MESQQDGLVTIALEINRALYNGNADQALILIAEYMRNRGLTANPEAVAAIPVVEIMPSHAGAGTS